MEEQVQLFQDLETIRQAALQDLQSIQDEKELQSWRSRHMGRNSLFMQVFSRLPEIPKELRPQAGQAANKTKNDLETALEARLAELKAESLKQSLSSERLDITLPGRRVSHGRLHPSTLTLRKIYRIFAEMGFQIFRSPDIETDSYNFEYLNMPPYHPARDMWDTFFTTNPNVLLRTHTSPGQIHAMREFAPDPIRVILPGMVYRYEQLSTRSEIQFNQVELLAVGRKITFMDLKGTLEDFTRRMFGEDAHTRLRPSYFPFTEPSAEMDVRCYVCGGSGCPVCKGSGWVEILGCGMVHPVVLRYGGYDPSQYTGFAAGLGPERITLNRYRIDDIRHFWANDIRFLEQFS
jgi:phenylalanyl-tRNA synthetase alpha chain